MHDEKEEESGKSPDVTPGEELGKASELKSGEGTYVAPRRNTDILCVYASLTGHLRILPAPGDSPDQRPTAEVAGHKARGAVPEPGCTVIARVTKVMAKMASADIMCVGRNSVREKFSGIIRQQDVRATEIDKVDMHLSFRAGDFLSLGDARAYYLSTAQNELGVVSAESAAGAALVPISWTEMQCPLTGQIEQRKVAKDSFDLPPDYFQQLPNDLRLDLNDAAFDLSNGPVIDECGQELGEILLNLSRAWEQADASSSCNLASKLPSLAADTHVYAGLALGKRLLSAGRRFQSMGQYGQGEPQKIAQAMISTGKFLSASSITAATDEDSKEEKRVLKDTIMGTSSGSSKHSRQLTSVCK
ncbi:hypothetical protein Tsubulata_005903 [Turnera subulata]|uniref:Exosome complex component CSL4 C-terminal domain-containing protein n=1 Tax=Turnera subulata TaxID=218843 RepID=A0A9Q0G5Z8_9ROSI|nr:hypothetical protein Tsubulata_005903 [Turnera subulata]